MSSNRVAIVIIMALFSMRLAAETPAALPILLEFSDDMGVKEPPPEAYGAGLIADWATRRANRFSAKKIARFYEWLPERDFNTKARAAFSCVPLGNPSGDCRPEQLLPQTPEQLRQVLESNAGGHGLIVRLQPLLGLKGYLLRAPTTQVELKDGKLSPVCTFTAVYVTRVPESLDEMSEKSEEPFKQYWLGKTPSVLTVEAKKGIAEVAGMLNTLYTQLTPEGNVPPAWRDLPKLTALQKAQRVRCRGVPCSGVRVYQDQPEALWLTFVPDMWVAGKLPADVGSAMVSLDANAANWQTNVWILTQAYEGY